MDLIKVEAHDDGLTFKIAHAVLKYSLNNTSDTNLGIVRGQLERVLLTVVQMSSINLSDVNTKMVLRMTEIQEDL